MWASYFLQFKIIFNFAQNIYIFEKCKISKIGNIHLLIKPLLPLSIIYVKCLIASSHLALHIHILISVNSTIIDHTAAVQKCVFSRLLQYHTHFSYKFFFFYFFIFHFSSFDFCFSPRDLSAAVGHSIWTEKIETISVTAIPSRKQDFPSDQYYLNC